MQKYQTLIADMGQTERKRVTLIPIVIGATGAVLKATVVSLASRKCVIEISWLQKIVAIETVKLVRSSAQQQETEKRSHKRWSKMLGSQLMQAEDRSNAKATFKKRSKVQCGKNTS